MSGGWKLNSVETYDYYENKWTHLADMIEERQSHSSVSMGNKLFLFPGSRNSTCEVFDSFSRLFCYIKANKGFTYDMLSFHAVGISNQIIIICTMLDWRKTKLFTYNVETNDWKLINCCTTLKKKHGFNCAKYHQ